MEATPVLRVLNHISRETRLRNQGKTEHKTRSCAVAAPGPESEADDPDCEQDEYEPDEVYYARLARADPKGSNFAAVSCGRIEVLINGEPLTVLLDSGSEINILSREKAENLGLAVEPLYRHVVHGIADNPLQLVGICENVLVNVGGICGRLSVYVAEDFPENILGRPFEVAFQTVSESDSAGNQYVTLHSEGKERNVRVKTASSGDQKNHRRQDQLVGRVRFLQLQIRATPNPVSGTHLHSNLPHPLGFSLKHVSLPSRCQVRVEAPSPSETLSGILESGDVDMVGMIGVCNKRDQATNVAYCHTMRKNVKDKVKPRNVALNGEKP
jgi:hypothetical protein